MRTFAWLTCFFIVCTTPQVKAQSGVVNDSVRQIMENQFLNNNPYKRHVMEINEEDIIKMADAQSAFGVYKDTYFTTGVPLRGNINKNTADAMFQISVRQRITKSHLPFNSFLYFTYTQKSFWDIYAHSSPFRDTNYNPSLGLGKYIIDKNKLMGAVFMQVEHESNGKDGDDSRSWNMISLSVKYLFNLQTFFTVKTWLSIVDRENNKDLLDYRGFGYASFTYLTKDLRWWITADVNPRKGFGNANTTLTAAFKVFKMHNQYMYFRFYNGKGDSLLDYNKYDMNIRIGFCIKPDFRSIF